MTFPMRNSGGFLLVHRKQRSKRWSKSCQVTLILPYAKYIIPINLKKQLKMLQCNLQESFSHVVVNLQGREKEYERVVLLF